MNEMKSNTVINSGQNYQSPKKIISSLSERENKLLDYQRKTNPQLFNKDGSINKCSELFKNHRKPKIIKMIKEKGKDKTINYWKASLEAPDGFTRLLALASIEYINHWKEK